MGLASSTASNASHAKATNGRGGRTPQDESAFATNPPSARPSGAREKGNHDEEDWLPLVAADPAFWLKDVDC